MPRVSPTYSGHPSLMAFGEAVCEARHMIGISQEELAHRAGVDRSYMSSIERGAQNPGLMLMSRLAQALELSLGELVTGAGL